MVDLVLQRTNADCVVASIAMFTGQTYGTVVHVAQGLCANSGCSWAGTEEPMSMSIMWATCEALGKPVLTGRYFLSDWPAMVTVLSPTRVGLYHMVFWDGAKIMDPLGEANGINRDWLKYKAIEYTHAIADLAPLVLDRFTFEQARTLTKVEHRAGEQTNG